MAPELSGRHHTIPCTCMVTRWEAAGFRGGDRPDHDLVWGSGCISPRPYPVGSLVRRLWNHLVERWTKHCFGVLGLHLAAMGCRDGKTDPPARRAYGHRELGQLLE